MNFSRSHAGMLGIVSVFTGMIAPWVTDGINSLPYSLTNAQIISYMVFWVLTLGFFFSSTRKIEIYRWLVGWVLVLVGVLGWMTLDGEIIGRAWQVMQGISWGWVFLTIGWGLILYSWRDARDGYKSADDASVEFFDTMIGIVGTITLMCLSAIIIFVSIGEKKPSKSELLLEQNFGTWQIESASGISQTRWYLSIPDIFFQRRDDTVVYAAEVTKWSYTVFPWWYTGDTLPIHVQKLWDKHIIIEWKTLTINNITQTNDLQEWKDNGESLLYRTSDTIGLLTENNERSFSWKNIIPWTLAQWWDTPVVAWAEKGNSWTTLIKKDGNIIHTGTYTVEKIDLSKSGYDLMALINSQGGARQILKNGEFVESIKDDYIPWSYRSNGSHGIYTIRDVGNTLKVIYDGTVVASNLAEVREVFLEKSGNSYAYFGRKNLTNEYCLFTRYKWNLCGLTGYMNPRLGADGGSILYAWLYNGNWWIYRNTAKIIENTWYTKKDVSNDYVFFDITNPKQYIFIERNNDGTYAIRKNGKIIPKIWKDVGLDIVFWYDNKVIMTARDESWWKLIEL